MCPAECQMMVLLDLTRSFKSRKRKIESAENQRYLLFLCHQEPRTGGGDVMSKCQYSLPHGLVNYQGWLASTFYLIIPTPTAGSMVGLGSANRWI